jgi:small nuclear ribonucleoprotein (snRNP)-like protein
MRWDDLFGDLEGQLAAAHDADFAHEVAELAAAERASVDLASRLAAARGQSVGVHLRGGEVLRGDLADATPTWILLRDGPRDHLIPGGAVAAVEGAAERSLPWGGVERRLGLGHALRALAETYAVVVVVTDGMEFRGRVTGVGADHLDLTPESGRASIVVSFSSILRVSST